jgi:hypothetical protein
MESKFNTVSDILNTFDICKEMILEVCNYTKDGEIAQFIITAVQDRVAYLSQEEIGSDNGDLLDATFKQGGF